MSAADDAPAQGTHHRRHRRRRRGRRALWVVLALAALMALLAGWLVTRGLQAKGHLLKAADAVSQLEREAKDGDVAAQRVTLARLQHDTAAARSETSDLVWRAVSAIPVAGRNGHAVRTLATAVDDLAQQALPALVNASATVDLQRLAPHDGRVNLTPLQQASSSVIAADQAVRRVRDEIDNLSTSGLLAPVRSAVARLRAELQSAARTTGRILSLTKPGAYRRGLHAGVRCRSRPTHAPSEWNRCGCGSRSWEPVHDSPAGNSRRTVRRRTAASRVSGGRG